VLVRAGTGATKILIGARQQPEGYIKIQKHRRKSDDIQSDEVKSPAMMWLLLEEIFEGLAGVGRTAGSRLRESGGDLRRLLIRSWRGVFLNGGPEFVELAVVLAVFGSNAFGDRLRTLKLRAGIEEAALFAAMKFGVALGAGAVGVETGDEHCSAIGAASASNRADHARSAGTKMIVLAARAALRRLTFGAGFLFFVAIAIAAMAVLTIHKYLRTLTITLNSSRNELGKFASQHSYTYENRFRAVYALHPDVSNIGCIQSDCYTWRDKRYFPKISGSEGTASYQEQETGQHCL
jgi:hypothetical protein